ncbi:MAG: NYN domain-containing protein [Spirosomaceae bacterium]|nr:NYN domain-containing protein [Spirosomataceae bacterium]
MAYSKQTTRHQLTRIGVFYDGNYFLHVSNYYNYTHERRSRISISGLHDFIRQEIAKIEQSDVRHCPIVDAHYFRGRLAAGEASQRGELLYYERVFEDILMSEGVTTHYLPVRTVAGRKHEKGIDVWLALETFELAFYKHFDMVVLIAADSDYVPLVRKLNTLGTRVMVLGWDFEYTDEEGNRFFTRTSQDLLEEATYPVAMHDIINHRPDAVINTLFAKNRKSQLKNTPSDATASKETEEQGEAKEPTEENNAERQEGAIMSLKDGFGFIKFPPNNVFFHYSSLRDHDFNDLTVGDMVGFALQTREDGRQLASEVWRLSV